MIFAVSDGVLIATVGGFFALSSGVVAALAHVYTSRAANAVQANTQAIAASQSRVDEWDRLLKAKDVEIARQAQRIASLERQLGWPRDE